MRGTSSTSKTGRSGTEVRQRKLFSEDIGNGKKVTFKEDKSVKILMEKNKKIVKGTDNKIRKIDNKQ